MYTYNDLNDYVKACGSKYVRTKTRDDQFPFLALFKFSTKAFFDHAFKDNPALTHLRGVVVDNLYEQVVQLPFDKVFNHNEPSCPKIPKDTPVYLHKKVNGFMGALTKHQGSYVISTTGDFFVFDDQAQAISDLVIEDNDFIITLYNRIFESIMLHEIEEDYTYLFEVCDPSDPHIVEEPIGLHLLGVRNKSTGRYANFEELNAFKQKIVFSVASAVYQPDVVYGLTYEQAIKFYKNQKHEGYVVYIDAPDGGIVPVTKLKTPYYLTKKFLMRMGTGMVSNMYKEKNDVMRKIDEQFYALVEHITTNVDEADWCAMKEHTRRRYIETFLYK